jgi:hypothetical protein
MEPTMTLPINLAALPPLKRLELASQLVDSLMGESDEAHDVYSDAFDALDEPALVRVFEDEYGNPRDLLAETRAAIVEAFGNDRAKEARQ